MPLDGAEMQRMLRIVEEVCERQKLFKCYQCGSITVLTFRIVQVVAEDGWRMVAAFTLLPGIFCLSIRLTGRMDGVFIGIEVQPLKFSPCSSAVLL